MYHAISSQSRILDDLRMIPLPLDPSFLWVKVPNNHFLFTLVLILHLMSVLIIIWKKCFVLKLITFHVLILFDDILNIVHGKFMSWASLSKVWSMPSKLLFKLVMIRRDLVLKIPNSLHLKKILSTLTLTIILLIVMILVFIFSLLIMVRRIVLSHWFLWWSFIFKSSCFYQYGFSLWYWFFLLFPWWWLFDCYWFWIRKFLLVTIRFIFTPWGLFSFSLVFWWSIFFIFYVFHSWSYHLWLIISSHT